MLSSERAIVQVGALLKRLCVVTSGCDRWESDSASRLIATISYETISCYEYVLLAPHSRETLITLNLNVIIIRLSNRSSPPGNFVEVREFREAFQNNANVYSE